MFSRPAAASARRLAQGRRAVCVSAARQHVVNASSSSPSSADANANANANANAKTNAAKTPSSASSSSSSPREKARPAAPAPDPPFATVPTCPAPTCGCAPTPSGLDIDHKSPLNGVISGYAEQVLVCTGRDDWASRIEEEDGGDNLAADLKELFGRGGTYSDPFHNVSVLNASFPSSTPRRRTELQTTSAYLLPSFKYVPFLPRVSFESVQALAKGYLLPEALHPMHEGLSPVHRDRLLRKDAYREMLYGVQDVREVVVLICGHGGRDARCGITGPVLRGEFERQLDGAGVGVLKGEVEGDVEENQGRRLDEGVQKQEEKAAARVGLISHIGGHKFAGNVIIYIPPGMKAEDGAEHGLAGKGIWYGRVEPRHVEGIVKETILGGRVISDMFRGGIDQERKILRI
ncbi:hypothetical protein ACHAQH_001625 [Verticillium albo-atrum]